MPQPWKDSLAAAVAGGKIPNYPQSIILQGNAPKYPDGVDPNSKTSVCSATYGCRIDSDLWDAPDGMFGVSFDDGPDPVSSTPLLLIFVGGLCHFFHTAILSQAVPVLGADQAEGHPLHDRCEHRRRRPRIQVRIRDPQG
jgi:hypothetical protein